MKGKQSMLVTKNVVTREEVIAAVKEVAGKLGRSPRYPEVIRVVNVTRRQIHRMFGGWAEALQESGCERLRAGGTQLTMHQLWLDWVQVARKVERVPTIRQYEKFSRYSVRPLKDRFKVWDRIPGVLLEYGEARGLWAGCEDVKTLIERVMDDCMAGKRYRTAQARQQNKFPLDCAGVSLPQRQQDGFVVASMSSLQQERAKATAEGGCATNSLSTRTSGAMPEVIDPETLYAEPMSLEPMAMAPENEQGVVFLFGVMARELGFVVIKLRSGFPDCEAFRRLPNGKWQRVRIEFEFQSRNFLLHGHNPNRCDLIVCWEHDWEGCSVEVLELKSRGGRLPELP